MEIRVDVAPAPSDVVCTPHQVPLGCGSGEAVLGVGALLDDGGNPLVAKIPAEGIFPCVRREHTSLLK